MYQGAFLHYVGWSPGEGKAPGAGTGDGGVYVPSALRYVAVM